MSAAPRPALLLDRDGVVNDDTGYLHKIAECRFVEGIFDLARAFARRGFAIVIATNQSGIGRGYYGEGEFLELMDWMRAAFAQNGVALDGVYYCPDHPTEGQGAYRRDSPRRKPGPGMLLEAAAELSLDLARSWCLGDQASDIAAGRAAGVGTLVLFDPKALEISRREDYWIVPRLADVVDLLLSERRQ
ncbi:MAG TPA: HAD family hydrolase [Stellaceae bacterium]|nr:HAD family hydrolase [Stellaceae bacterium]